MRAALALAALLAGCYDPHPPSGAYSCGSPDHDGGGGSCPKNQTCECGQCVDHEGQAACSFRIDVSGVDGGVDEHQPFNVTVTAYAAADGGVASGFAGDVTLSSTWGDVCVGTGGCVGRPDRVRLAGGVGTATIQLNRETVSPQTAVLRATFAGATGTSGLARISVRAPRFHGASGSATPDTIAPALAGGTATFGPGTTFAGSPSVIVTPSEWRMYFLAGDNTTTAIGLATSPDGKTFTASTSPAYLDPGNATGPPSAVVNGDDVSFYFGAKNVGAPDMGAPPDMGATPRVGYQQIATVSGALDTLLPGPPAPLFDVSQCPYCLSFDAPTVLPDPNPALSGSSAGATLMYFAALSNGADGSSYSEIGRATSPDGKTYAPDPSAVLKTTSNELAIYVPRIYVDGSVYKMWYSVLPSLGTLCGSTVDRRGVLQIAYATSTDGLFWVRSSDNGTMSPPYVLPTPDGKFASSFVGAVQPRDGRDPSSGFLLFFSGFSSVKTGILKSICVPDGIYRVERD